MTQPLSTLCTDSASENPSEAVPARHRDDSVVEAELIVDLNGPKDLPRLIGQNLHVRPPPERPLIGTDDE